MSQHIELNTLTVYEFVLECCPFSPVRFGAVSTDIITADTQAKDEPASGCSHTAVCLISHMDLS